VVELGVGQDAGAPEVLLELAEVDPAHFGPYPEVGVPAHVNRVPQRTHQRGAAAGGFTRS
jgi:hypothetical protein